MALACALLSVTGASAQDREWQGSEFERAVLEEFNRARTDPAGYAESLRDYLRHFDGRDVRLPGDPVGIRTHEGPAAVLEAIEFLESREPLPPLEASPLLSLAASDHVRDQGPRGTWGHASSDGSRPGHRVERRGGGRYVSEVISYGASTGAAVVRQLIVDDGVAHRGHRSLMFQDIGNSHAGIACGHHARYETMCVIDLSRWHDGRFRMASSD